VVHSPITALLVAAPSPGEGVCVCEQGGGGATGPGSNESLVLHGSEQLWARTGLVKLDTSGGDTERTTEKRRRTATVDSGEAEKTKKAKLETTSADSAIAQRKENNSSGNSGAGSSSDDSSNAGGRAVQGGTRRLAEARGKEGGLTSWLSSVGAAHKWLPTLP
jgi:hypothetical protein